MLLREYRAARLKLSVLKSALKRTDNKKIFLLP